VFPEDGVIVQNGNIDPDTPQDFDLALAAASELKKVMLRSPGGVFVSTVNTAATIMQRQLITFVEEKQNYASTCSIIFLLVISA